jgi:hypothetical protein
MNQKKLFVGSLEVSVKEGKLWINDVLGGCRLRMNKIDFQNSLQKFDFIDINKNKAYMIKNTSKNNSEDEAITNFVQNLINLLFSKMEKRKLKTSDLNALLRHIENYFDKKGGE